MYKYHFSYKELSGNDNFLRGHNVYLEVDNMIEAIKLFNSQKPNSDIQGVLKTVKEKEPSSIF